METITIETINKLVEESKNSTLKTISLGMVDGEEITVELKANLTIDDLWGICASVLQADPFRLTDDGVAMYIPSAELINSRTALIKALIPALDFNNNIMESFEAFVALDIFRKVDEALSDNSMYRFYLELEKRYSEYFKIKNGFLIALQEALSEIDLSKIADMGELNTALSGFMENIKENIGFLKNVNEEV